MYSYTLSGAEHRLAQLVSRKKYTGCYEKVKKGEKRMSDYKKLLWTAASVLIAGIGMVVSEKKDSVARAEMKAEIKNEVLDELSCYKSNEGDS